MFSRLGFESDRLGSQAAQGNESQSLSGYTVVMKSFSNCSLASCVTSELTSTQVLAEGLNAANSCGSVNLGSYFRFSHIFI